METKCNFVYVLVFIYFYLAIFEHSISIYRTQTSHLCLDTIKGLTSHTFGYDVVYEWIIGVGIFIFFRVGGEAHNVVCAYVMIDCNVYKL